MVFNLTNYLWVMCVFLFPGICVAASPQTLVKQGNSAYEKKQYDQAIKAYESAGVNAPESAEIHFNKGAVYYRQGEYERAKESWEKSALHSKDRHLEAKSLFNLGNAAFQLAKRHQNINPQKALEAYAQSVAYYQQAIDILNQNKHIQNPKLVKETAENMEWVRRVMKSVMDAMHQQQDQAQQQAARDALNELIQKQQELIDRNQYLRQEKKDNNEFSEKIAQMAQDQQRLSEQTQEVSDQIKSSESSTSNPPESTESPTAHLSQAQSQQREASQKMAMDDLDAAGSHQASALKALQDALSSLEKQKGSPGDLEKKDLQGQDLQVNKDVQTTADQQPDDKTSFQEQQNSCQAQSVNATQALDNDKDTWIGAGPDDAQRILDEEKENQKYRFRQAPGGYRDVDKDW